MTDEHEEATGAEMGAEEEMEAVARMEAVAGGCADEAGEGGELRLSEINPMNLGDLFAKDPELAKKGGGAKVPRSLLFAGSRLDDELELRKLQVFVRIRPSQVGGAGAAASAAALENCVHATSRHSIAIAPPEGSQAYKSGDRGQTYSFSRVFDADTSQEEYYASTAEPLVRDLLRNRQHNSVMMAYGITAAGKTFTIEGTKAAPGVMPRALADLFAGLASHVEPIGVRVSYYEVYNEQIYDLLDEGGVGPLGQRVPLRLKEDALGRVFVAGLSEVEVGSAEEALAALRRGSRQRQRAETGLNYSSSRSHSIFTVALFSQPDEPEREEEESGGSTSPEGERQRREEKLGRVSFVDLAGSERAQRTGNVGVRLKESVAINSSLMTLGRCLEALRWNQQHRDKGTAALRVVPYRESKVTHLFRDALHGWGQVILSVNVSPVSCDYDETAHVLRYAALATQIGTIQQAEAPRRTIKAVSPAIKKVKRKAALPPEARRQAKAKKSKTTAAVGETVQQQQQEQLAAIAEEGSGRDGSEERAGGMELPAMQTGVLPEGLLPELAELGPCDGAAVEGEEQGPGAGSFLLGAGEYDGTPTTPQAELDLDDEVVALQAQVQQLIGDLQKAEERCVLVEAEVRQEVADEMSQLLRDMEANYRERLAAEVEALERKLGGQAASTTGAAADAGGKRGRKAAGGNKKGAQAAEEEGGSAAPAPAPAPVVEELAVAQAAVAAAEGRAEQLQQERDGLAAELAAAQARMSALEGEAEQGRAALAAKQEQAGALDAALAHEREHVRQLHSEAEAARTQAECLAAELAAERQHAAALQSSLAAAQAAAAGMEAELEAARAHAAGLEEDLQAAVRAAEAAAADASQDFESQLQEQLTQMEANAGMEVEMLEQQLDRARKDNGALRQRLEAAMATLASLASPSKGPLLAKLAQAAPAGKGKGAAGTPHDIALARARRAAAEEASAEVAAAEAAAGGSLTAPLPNPLFTGTRSTLAQPPRGRSRFAQEAAAAAAAPSVCQEDVQPMEMDAVAPSGMGTAHEQEQQEQVAAEAAPAPRRRGRPRKQQQSQNQQEEAPAAPAPEHEAAAVPELVPEAAAAAPAPAVESVAAENAPLPAESKRTRRMTRAAMHAAAPPEEAEPVQAEQPKQSRRGRRAGRAAASAAPKPLEAVAEAEEEDSVEQPAMQLLEEALPEAEQAAAEVAEQPAAEQVSEQPALPVPEEASAAAPAAEEAKPRRKRGRPHRKAAAAEEEQVAAEAAAAAAPAIEAAEEHQAADPVADEPPAVPEQPQQLEADPLSEQEAAADVQEEPAAAPARGRGRRQTAVGSGRRRASRMPDKENGSEAGPAAAGPPAKGGGRAVGFAIPEEPQEEAAQAEQQEEVQAAAPAREQQPAAGGGGKRRKRLLLSKPMSAEMRHALGEWNAEDGELLAHKAASHKVAGMGSEASRPARTRRQTQFYRL